MQIKIQFWHYFPYLVCDETVRNLADSSEDESRTKDNNLRSVAQFKPSSFNLYPFGQIQDVLAEFDVI